jgi:hypothetical protein
MTAIRTKALSSLAFSLGLWPLLGLLSRLIEPDLACLIRKEEIVLRGIFVLVLMAVGV